MLNKCVKLILILALVVAVAFGVSFLPFSLSDKFKQVAEKVTSHIKGLAGLNKNGGAKLNLDFAKRDNYKLGEFNVVFEKVNNVPKEGFHKFVHKGENDAVLDVEKFFNGETELEGLEGGLFDYAAAYFKGDTPHLLLVELGLHEEEKDANADKAGEKNEGEAKEGENKENAAPAKPAEAKPLPLYFAPGENNKWVKLPEGANLGEKLHPPLQLQQPLVTEHPKVAMPEAQEELNQLAALQALVPVLVLPQDKVKGPLLPVDKVEQQLHLEDQMAQLQLKTDQRAQLQAETMEQPQVLLDQVELASLLQFQMLMEAQVETRDQQALMPLPDKALGEPLEMSLKAQTRTIHNLVVIAMETIRMEITKVEIPIMDKMALLDMETLTVAELDNQGPMEGHRTVEALMVADHLTVVGHQDHRHQQQPTLAQVDTHPDLDPKPKPLTLSSR
nr:hypothetical protein MACL_00003358 [Theileria orientalis]